MASLNYAVGHKNGANLFLSVSSSEVYVF